MSIFIKGDTVHHFNLGRGVVEEIFDDSVSVKFQEKLFHFPDDLLSFKPYSLHTGGFSHSRPPVLYDNLIGKIGIFKNGDKKIIDEVDHAEEGLFIAKSAGWFNEFRELTESELEIYNNLLKN